jgi:hypothetical protein
MSLILESPFEVGELLRSELLPLIQGSSDSLLLDLVLFAGTRYVVKTGVVLSQIQILEVLLVLKGTSDFADCDIGLYLKNVDILLSEVEDLIDVVDTLLFGQGVHNSDSLIGCSAGLKRAGEVTGGKGEASSRMLNNRGARGSELGIVDIADIATMHRALDRRRGVHLLGRVRRLCSLLSFS